MMEFNGLPSFSYYGMLIPNEDRNLVKLYLQWLKLLALRGIHQKHIHDKTFNYLYRAVSKEWSDKYLLGKLQKEFIKRNLSLSLLLEPLDGFSWISKNRYTLTFDKATPILLQIISPIARLVTILNNARPPLYQPLASLIFVYVIIYVLNSRDIQKILEKSSFRIEKNRLIKQLPLLLKEAKGGISVISAFHFKYKIARLMALARLLIKKNSKHTQNNINFLDSVNVFLYGLWYILSIKDNSQGLNKL